MSRLVILEFSPEAFSFSAGHFTLFSATERERLHGHNYSVAAVVGARIQEPGITFDYLAFKTRLHAICDAFDRYLLLPTASPYLKISDCGDNYEVSFQEDVMFFLKKDTQLLPIENTTLEELSRFIAEQLITDTSFILRHRIEQLTIKVFNGPEQSAAFSWQANSHE